MSENDLTGLEIAIIGMACRLPDADDFEQFWQNLKDGLESVRFFSDEELEAAGVPRALIANPYYVKARSVLKDIEWFDAAFFDYNPKEAQVLDPQQRIFLECAWHALENAAYDPQRVPGPVGLYASTTISEYAFRNLVPNPDVMNTVGPFQALISNDKDFLTTRASYKLDLRGPSINIQSACSSSLVATHLACRALIGGECDLALAGGVSARVAQVSGYLYQEGGIESPDGHCRAFDADARGTSFGSGVGVVVLKRLAEAIEDGDQIYAVIKGTAINNDGADKVGYTAPSVSGQAQVIRMAQQIADVSPETISYIESHGTGTSLGDPIEVAALTQTFRESTPQKQFCAIGSLKTNIGHLDAAAGVAGLIKTVLSLQHRQIPPSLNFTRPNLRLDLENSPFYVNTKLSDWPTSHTPRRAGISSFGVGGTNAHAILEEAPVLETSGPSRAAQLLVLSAKTSTALEAMSTRLVDHLRANPALPLADAAYTLQLGRKNFEHRRMLVCADTAEALEILETKDPRRIFNHSGLRTNLQVAFLFPGQGAQYAGMAKGIYEAEATFRREVDRCAALLQNALGLDIRTVVFSDSAEINQTHLAQPALFVIEYALAKLWMLWGIKPQAMLGHSLGEYVAACLADVFSLEDALQLVAIRGKLMQQMTDGAMLAATLSEKEARPLLGEKLSLAAINGPAACVFSGPTAEIEALEKNLLEKGILGRRLKTSHAFHSLMVEPMLVAFKQALGQIHLKTPQKPYISNLTGDWIKPEEASDPDYWCQHLRQTVRFADGIQTLMQSAPEWLLLEVGPGQTLSSLSKPQLDAKRSLTISSMRHPNENQPDSNVLLNALGRVWLTGVKIDWAAFYKHERRRRITLPGYPFERQRFWIDAHEDVFQPASPPTQKRQPESWFYTPIWQPGLPPAAASQPQRWLIFSEGQPIAYEVSEGLKGLGHFVQTAHAPEDIGRLLQPERILYWVSDHFNFDRLIELIQILEKNQQTTVSLTIISEQGQSVSPTEIVNPQAAPCLGLMLVAPHEYPEMTCRSIDIDIPAAGWLRECLTQNLLAELTGETIAPVVAYRHARRWIQCHLPVQVTKNTRSSLRKGGVYLITGGLGQIGQTLARHLAQHWQARLVLTSRTGLPPRENWAQHSDNERIRFVQALEAQGTEVLVLAADVANAAQMRQVIDQTMERFGALNGVIQAAVSDTEAFVPISNVTPESHAAQCHAKITGTQVLAEALQGTTLDFCVLFSSLAATLGGVGFASYAAGNKFQDTFAQQQNQRGPTPWISINWDRWHFGDVSANQFVSELDALSIFPEEGMRCFEMALTFERFSPLVVSTHDLRPRLDRWVNRTGEAILKTDDGAYARPKLMTEYVAPRNDMETQLAGIWQSLLGIESIGVYDNFLELGGNSLIATRMVSQVRDQFAVEFPLRRFLETPTIADMVQAIAELQLGDVLDEDAVIALLAEIQAQENTDGEASPQKS